MENKDQPRRVLVIGGTGYLGRSLIPVLFQKGHEVRALVRAGSESKLPSGCRHTSIGNPLDCKSYRHQLREGDTLVHLLGTAHPAPWKAKLFKQIDLVSVQVSIAAAQAANVGHVVYVSVAQPAPVMRAYIAVRQQCEALIRESGIPATIVRPWYVLGPGHHWPRLLLPVYWLLECTPATTTMAKRLGLVMLSRMTQALVWAIEHPSVGIEIIDVDRIRQLGKL